MDYESEADFVQQLRKNMKKFSGDSSPNVEFDFSQFHFVGSCGLSKFMADLRSIQEELATQYTFRNVRSEFTSLMRAAAIEAIIEVSHSQETPRAPRGKKILGHA